MHEVVEKVPFITRTLTPFEVLSEEGLATIEHNADTILETVGIDFREAPDAHKLLPGPAARSRVSVCGSRAASRRRLVQATAPREFDQYSRKPGDDRAPGGHRHRARARLRLAVRPRPRRGPPLRHDRGLPQLREARLLDPVPAPLGRHGVRAGRPARQQAALRHGLRAHALLGQAVHGLGHAPAPRARHGRHGADHVRRRRARGTPVRDEPDQREQPARVGLDDARRRRAPTPRRTRP